MQVMQFAPLILFVMEKLNVRMEETLYNLQQIIDYAEENNLTSSQEFINFLDSINEYSVRY